MIKACLAPAPSMPGQREITLPGLLPHHGFFHLDFSSRFV